MDICFLGFWFGLKSNKYIYSNNNTDNNNTPENSLDIHYTDYSTCYKERIKRKYRVVVS